MLNRFFRLGQFCLLFSLLLLIWPAGAARASGNPPQTIKGLYVHTFGDPGAQPIVFVHGGPGFDSWSFESTTAASIAARGFYVVVYDQRGQGRSLYTGPGDYTFRKSVKDLKLVIDWLKLRSPLIMGHSFGGPIALDFEKAYPGLAKKIILVSGTIDNWATMHSTYENCLKKFGNNPAEKAKLDEDFSRIFAYEFCDREKAGDLHGLPCDSRDDAQPLPPRVQEDFIDLEHKTCPLPPFKDVETEGSYESKCDVYRAFLGPGGQAANDLLGNSPLVGEKPHGDALKGFYRDPDSFIRMDGLPYATAHRNRFCGVYGDHDGLFTPKTLAQLKKAFPVAIVPSGHNVFLDQNRNFLKYVRAICGF